MRPHTIKIGLLGCGVVGGGLLKLLEQNRALITQRSGFHLLVHRILVRDLHKSRVGNLPPLTTDADSILNDPEIDIVVELIGGLDPARRYVEQALKNGKPLVTANKALLAAYGDSIFRLAASSRSPIGVEASVCAGIPLLESLKHGLVANRIEKITGIVNGTTNYILTRMTEESLSFEQALMQAQRNGFCEADPSMDLDGIDAAHKLVILAEIAFGTRIALNDVPIEGIRSITAEDVRRADCLGFIIKHLVIGQRIEDALLVSVCPALIPKRHPLASVRNESNAVSLVGDAVGHMLFSGKGAGALPTASAILSDIIEVAKIGKGEQYLPQLAPARIISDVDGEFYIRFPIEDRPGVIGHVTTILGKHQVSISHTTATLVDDAGHSRAGNLTVLVHRCKRSMVVTSIDEIQRSGAVRGEPVLLQIFSNGQ